MCLKIGKYEDSILYDILPMEACHLLLGRPWEFDRRVMHDGHTNKYSFMHYVQKIILAPLNLSEVREDQDKLREKHEQEKREKEKEKKKKRKKEV